MRPRLEITTEMFAKRNEYMVLVSNLTGVPVDDIMGGHRCGEIATARQLVMWALVTLCGYSHTQTGILMRRNHATITYGVNHVGGGYYGNKIQHIRKQIQDYHETKTQSRH